MEGALSSRPGADADADAASEVREVRSSGNWVGEGRRGMQERGG